MVNDVELGALIARDIFKALDAPHSQCKRIEGRGGEWPDKEIKLGGLCEEALAGLIKRSLAEHRSY